MTLTQAKKLNFDFARYQYGRMNNDALTALQTEKTPTSVIESHRE